MQYKVTKKYGSGSETNCKIFPTLNEAREFVKQNAESDAAMKIKSIYRIYEFDDLIQEVDSSKVDLSATDNQESSAQGKQSSASFRPTPLATAPRPAGMPKNNWREDEEEKKDK